MRICSAVLIAAVAVALFAGSIQAAAPRTAELPDTVTFAEHIAPLVFNNCTGCHRSGQVAPFTLLNYNETRKHARTMLRVMQDRYMPPWQPEPGHGEFRNERRLSTEQIALFEKWVRTGMAEGDPKRVPPLPAFPEGWQLGKPDLIVKMDRPFEVPAEGPDIYRNFVIPLNLSEDKWVTAVEFRATAPSVLHHILYFLDDTGAARRMDGKDGQPGFLGMAFRRSGALGGWAVGATPVKLPDGLAYPLRKGSDLILQTHFHLSGKAESETITVGLYFADKPPSRTLIGLQLPPAYGLFSNINIPPGKTFQVNDSFTLPVDVELIAAGGHAHYIAKTLKTEAKLPNGETKSLFYIRDWDFNWQGQYLYKERVRLPKGTVLRGEVTWDNTDRNPRNPSSPPVRVRWGEGSTDEMGSVSLLMITPNAEDTPILQQAVRNQLRNAFLRSRLRGDKIDWKGLGLDQSPLFKDLPGGLKKAQPKKEPLSFRDLDGKEHQPLQVKQAKAHVLLFATTQCPIANGYIPEINALVREFADQPIRFYSVQVDPDLTVEQAQQYAREYRLTLPVLLDSKHQLVKATEVTRVPEAAVVLPDGSLAYRGRIDDRHPGLGKKRLAPGQRDLRNALTAILAGQPVTVSRTEAVGCSIPELPAQ